MEDQAITVASITAFSLIIAYLVSLGFMLSAAKNYDPKLFEEMGSPHIIKNSHYGHMLSVLYLLLSLKYWRSISSKVVLCGNIALSCFVLTFISWVLAYVT
jgi:hypothetical protein